MILTVTLSPSLDYYMTVNELMPLATNRAKASRTVYGGKGINVSAACENLNINNTALGFCGGYTGAELIRLCENAGIDCDFTKTDAVTRINIKCVTDNGITEINSSNSPVTRGDFDRLTEKISRVGKGDTVIISGSCPDCGVDKPLVKLCALVKECGASLILDTSDKSLTDCLMYKPELIKPNKRELFDICGETAATNDGIFALAEKLITRGAQNVLVSLGGDGALLVSENKIREYLPVPQYNHSAVNATGAGDSMIAGWLYAGIHSLPRLACSVAAGSATAYSDGICPVNLFGELLKRILKDE